MGSKQLGVVVVGTGFGCRIHVPAARAAGLDVVALVGRDEARTSRRAARLDIDHPCTSLAEALARPGADIVIVATPPPSHLELAEQAIAAGRHVLVEKPFTPTIPEAEHLVSVAEKAGVVALVGHEFRFAPERVAFHDALASNTVGLPVLATMIGLNPLLTLPGITMPSWWWEPDGGGGWLGASVSHLLDAIRVWLGEVESVSAVLANVCPQSRDAGLEDSVSARMRMHSGCEVVLQQSGGTYGPQVDVVRVSGPEATVSMEGTRITITDAEGARDLEVDAAADPDLGGDALANITKFELGPATTQARILRALASGAEPDSSVPAATFADGLASVRLMAAFRESAASGGRTVQIDHSPALPGT